jgi:hypothetical protein
MLSVNEGQEDEDDDEKVSPDVELVQSAIIFIPLSPAGRQAVDGNSTDSILFVVHGIFMTGPKRSTTGAALLCCVVVTVCRPEALSLTFVDTRFTVGDVVVEFATEDCETESTTFSNDLVGVISLPLVLLPPRE